MVASADRGTKAADKVSWAQSLRISPTIELGHILQAVIMLATVGGWAAVGYMSIQKQIDQQVAVVELIKQRQTTHEIGLNDLREAQKASMADTRTRLDRISDQISDLRTLVAAGQNAPRR